MDVYILYRKWQSQPEVDVVTLKRQKREGSTPGRRVSDEFDSLSRLEITKSGIVVPNEVKKV